MIQTDSFFSYYLYTIIKPEGTFDDLLLNRKSLRCSLVAVSITAILYTFVYVFLVFSGGQPFKPLLNIPLETNYSFNIFFCATGMFAELPAGKVAVGLPACQSAAGDSYTDTATVLAAIDYLRGNGPQSGSYTLSQSDGYPDLHGMMT